MESKRFKSTTGKDVRVALTSGHVAIIGTQWVELHPRFFSLAYANGCISEDMVKSTGLLRRGIVYVATYTH